MGAILDVATGWTLFAGLLFAIGGCGARWLLVPRVFQASEPDAGEHVLSAAGRLAFGGAILLVPAMCLFFLRQLVEFRDPFVPWTEDAQLLLTGTPWGTTWLRGAGASLVLVAALGLAVRGMRAVWWIGTLAALALGAFPALTGHASGSDGPRLVTMTADMLHVWAASVWGGGLAFVLYAEGRWRRSQGDPATPASLLPSLVPAFSPLAVACVGLLVISGAVGAWIHVPSVTAITGSPYGRTLLFKLVLVGGALAVGFVNWRVFAPRLGTPEGPATLKRAATIELLTVQAVLVVTALLVRTAPPMQ